MTTQTTIDAAVATETTETVLRITQAENATLEELLTKAGMPNTPEALIFWEGSGLGLQAHSQKCLSNTAIEFKIWDGTTTTQLIIRSIQVQAMKPAAFYEIVMFAASNPAAFRRVLNRAPILVQTVAPVSYLTIRLLPDGTIGFKSTDRIDHLEPPMQLGGAYFL